MNTKPRRQQTFDVGGHVIKMVSIAKSYMNHHNGFKVVITDNRNNKLVIPHINTLYRQEAEDKAFAQFVQEYC